MAKRLSAQDLRKKHDDLNQKVEALEARIKARLNELVKAHPDVIVAYQADAERTPLKAKSLESKGYIDDMGATSCLIYIERIEKYLAEQHPHQQQELFN